MIEPKPYYTTYGEVAIGQKYRRNVNSEFTLTKGVVVTKAATAGQIVQALPYVEPVELEPLLLDEPEAYYTTYGEVAIGQKYRRNVNSEFTLTKGVVVTKAATAGQIVQALPYVEPIELERLLLAEPEALLGRKLEDGRIIMKAIRELVLDDYCHEWCDKIAHADRRTKLRLDDKSFVAFDIFDLAVDVQVAK